MTLSEMCRAIESHEMAARVNVASDLRVALDIVRIHPTVREFVKALNELGVAERILRRTFELAEQATDVRYENPNDVALMIYTWLLHQQDAVLASVASAAVCQVSNLWWASKFCTQVIERPFGQNEMAGTLSTPVMHKADSGDRLFAARMEFSPLTPFRFLGRSTLPGLRDYRDVQMTLMPVEEQLPFLAELGRFTAWAVSQDTAETESLAA